MNGPTKVSNRLLVGSLFVAGTIFVLANLFNGTLF